MLPAHPFQVQMGRATIEDFNSWHWVGAAEKHSTDLEVPAREGALQHTSSLRCRQISVGLNDVGCRGGANAPTEPPAAGAQRLNQIFRPDRGRLLLNLQSGTAVFDEPSPQLAHPPLVPTECGGEGDGE